MSRQMVARRQKDGHIETQADGSIDPKQADAAVEDIHPGKRTATDLKNRGFATARAMREKYMAKMAKLEFERESGKLIPLEIFTREVEGMVQIASSRLMGIGNRLAPQVAIESNISACQSLIDGEISQILADLSRYRPSERPQTT